MQWGITRGVGAQNILECVCVRGIFGALLKQVLSSHFGSSYNDTDLKFGTHTLLDGIFVFPKNDPELMRVARLE